VIKYIPRGVGFLLDTILLHGAFLQSVDECLY
jgi:hypothetical protein